MKTIVMRRMSVAACALLLSAVVVDAQSQEPGEQSLEVTIRLLPENAASPEDITRRIELPPAARIPTPADGPNENPPQGREEGLENAAEARERGREAGQETAEQARENRENVGRPDDVGPPSDLGRPDDAGPPEFTPGRP